MKIRRVLLRDFGPYRGEYPFDFESATTGPQNPPVILFRGKNGSGKSTLFQAISICIYGPFFTGVKLKEDEYRKFITERVMGKGQNDDRTESYVRVDLEYTERGIRYNLSVERRWLIKGESLGEEIKVLSEAEGKGQVRITYPQEFLLNLLPAGLSQLIFFDGEKIHRLTELESPTSVLKEGFQTLIGMDVVDQLERDLTRYSYWLSKKEDNGNHSHFDKLEEEIKRMFLEKEKKRERLSETCARLDAIQKEITATELKLSKQGSEYAKYRTALHEKEYKLRSEKESIERSISDLFSEELPFAFAPSLSERTRRSLLEESKILGSVIASEAIEDAESELRERLTKDRIWNGLQLEKRERNAILKKILTSVKENLLKTSNGANLKHRLSPFDAERVVDALEKAKSDALEQFRHLVSEHTEVKKSLAQVTEDLSRMPSEEDLRPLVTELQELVTNKAKYESEKEALEEHIDSLAVEIERKRSQQEKEVEMLEASKKHSRKLHLAGKARDAIAEFKSHLASAYIEQLSNEFHSVYNDMRPKNKEIDRVSIDPDSFEIKILHNDGRMARSSVLSSGEQQMFAFALLGAILFLSKKPLPVLIDTPFARLDKQHRGSVISKLIPLVGSQIIMFATETEITPRVRRMLEPFIGMEYHLVMDGRSKKTRVRLIGDSE